MPSNIPLPIPAAPSSLHPLLEDGWLIRTLAPKLLPIVRNYGLKMITRYAAMAAAAVTAWAMSSGFMHGAPNAVNITGALLTLGTFALDAAISFVSHRLGLIPKALPVAEGEEE